MGINKDAQKAPILRFKGFTDDWERCKLINVVDRVTRRNTNLQSKTPLTISAQFGLVDQITYFSKQVASKNMENYFLLYNGDFAYNKSYSKGYPFGAIKRLDLYDSGALSTLYIVFRPTIVDSNFLVHYFETTKWYAEIIKISAEGARNHGLLNITPSDFFDIKLFIPSKSVEQEKIGTLINYVENTITLHQRKLDQLNQLKEALLQQMFPGKGETVPKLRFAGFEGDWEERKLGDLLHERNQKSVQTEEYPLVSFTVENGVTEKTERYNRNQLVSGDSDAKVYKVTKLNDIVYNPANLKFGAIDRNKYGKAVFSPIYVTFEVIEDYIFAEFIEFIVTSQTFIGRALKYQQGTVYERQSVGVDDFLNLTIRIPNLDEQKLIGLFLNDLNKELLLQKDKLDQLKHMKQVLLQNMFI